MKRILICAMCAVFLLGALLPALGAKAAEPLDTDRACSLTIHYGQEGAGFEGLNIQIYRVAEALADGSFRLISPYSGFPVSIYDVTTQQEWKTVAGTMASYIAAAEIAPDFTVETDVQGKAVFSSLETGLYLILGTTAENATGIYLFDDFLMYLPNYQDGSYCYHMEAKPKCSSFTPVTEYRVTKLWQDAGSEAKRPDSITVEIRKDGVLQQTQVLSSENQWSYSWKVTGDQGRWTVTEKDVPEGYTVTVSQKEQVFVVTNTADAVEEPPPTGDTFPMWPYLLTMCVSGLLLLALGIWRGRSR